MNDRYDISDSAEGEHQPGSNGAVLRNKPGITDPDEMDWLEYELLGALQHDLHDEIETDQSLAAENLRDWHRRWLEPVYEWAGRYRTVNLSKEGFPFAAAKQIPGLIDHYERRYLQRWTPCDQLAGPELVRALAECHVELILIHPFRDGSGRLARTLASVMALQAGYPPLDFEIIKRDRERYISAIHAGHGGNCQPMIQIFCDVLAASANG